MSDEKFISFFDQCIERIKDKTLTDSQLQIIAEFYITFLFTDTNNIDDISNKELLKYISMGWYVYNELKKTK